MALDWNDPTEVQKRRQQAINAGYSAKQVDEFINKKRNEQAQLNLAQQGVLNVEDIAKTDPIIAQQAIKQGAKTKPSKEEEATSGVLGLIDTLKGIYNQSNAAGVRPDTTREDDLSAASAPGFGGVIQGWKMGASAALNAAPDAKTYKRLKEGFTASLKEVTGDTGVLTDQDYARIVNALPDFGDTDVTARKSWQAIDKILQSKFGKVGNFSYLEEQAAPSNNNFPQESLVPGNQAAPNIPQRPPMQPWEGNALLGKTPLGALFSGRLDQFGPALGESIKNNPTLSTMGNPNATRQEQIDAALNFGALPAAGAKVAAATIKGIPKTVVPARVGKSMRESAVKKATELIPGKNIVQAIEEWATTAKKANPGKTAQIEKILKETGSNYAQDNLTPENAYKIWNEVDSGFTRSGVSKTSIEASADQAMRGILRKEIEKVAPGFEEGTKLIGKGLKRGDLLKKLLFPTLIGAGVGVPLSIGINKVLNPRQ